MTLAAAMTAFEQIHALSEHPDTETLRGFDQPSASLQGWRGILTAKAWIGSDLACFFTSREGGDRVLLLFKLSKAYSPTEGGHDMRFAHIGAVYDLDVFVSERLPPMVERAERIGGFP